jgi:plastocyanin
MKLSEGRPGIGSGVIIALMAVIAILISGATYYSTMSGTANPPTSSAKQGATSNSSPPAAVQVTLPVGVGTNQSYNFQPKTITLVIGVNNTVTWANIDAAPHTVTSTSVPTGAASFNSGNMVHGTTFTYTFTVPGTYRYDCTYHYWMQGTIVVSQAH